MPSLPQALIVSGNDSVQRTLSEALRTLDVSAVVVEGVDQAFPHLEGGGIDVLFVDFCLRDGTGLELLEAARSAGVRLNVLMGQTSDLNAAEELLRDGVAEYLPVPVEHQRLAAIFRRAAEVEAIRLEEGGAGEGEGPGPLRTAGGRDASHADPLRPALYTAFLLSQGDEVDPDQFPSEVLNGAGREVLNGGPVQIEVGSSVKDAERRLILTTLASVDGHKTRASELLGISLKTLYNRLHEYGYPLGPLT
jgi:DNA-binding NtrC family response regulator